MMRIGVICPSEIALRRFMPAIQKIDNLTFVGVGVCDREELFMNEKMDADQVVQAINRDYEKAKLFVDEYGGEIYDSYEKMVKSSNLDAIYIPLPPALHYKWAKMALEAGKHVLVEKPSTVCEVQSKELVEIARKKGLALHENYMFSFHNQLKEINDLVESGIIGEVRLHRISFGFPKRTAYDFRYNKELGGGALLDAGGYTIKYASNVLGKSAKITYATMNTLEGYNVDMYGSGALSNDEGEVVQISYGMDNEYKCELEIWGSNGCIYTDRILTAPIGYIPKLLLKKDGNIEERYLSEDDTFKKSIIHFIKCIENNDIREETFDSIVKQAHLVDEFRNMSS